MLELFLLTAMEKFLIEKIKILEFKKNPCLILAKKHKGFVLPARGFGTGSSKTIIFLICIIVYTIAVTAYKNVFICKFCFIRKL